MARIVDEHRGTIEVDSEVGRSTTVIIHLPMAHAHPDSNGSTPLSGR